MEPEIPPQSIFNALAVTAWPTEKAADSLTVNEAIVRALPVVVVPPLIVRLLKVVKILAGKVLLAVNSTVPVLGVQTAPVPEVVMAPFTFKVELAVMVNVLTCVATAPKTRLPASNVAPLWKVMVPLLFVFPELPIVTAPVTVNLGLPVLAKASLAVLLFDPKLKEAQV